MQYICEVDIFVIFCEMKVRMNDLLVFFFSEIMVKWFTDSKEERPAVIKENGKWVGLFFLFCSALHHKKNHTDQEQVLFRLQSKRSKINLRDFESNSVFSKPSDPN